MTTTTRQEYEKSLKSLETENFLDRNFYRPIAFRIAWILRNTGITPNLVTIISIFIGITGGILFYPQNIWINLTGVFLLIFANLLDCVDGQLARLTGIKSPIGRILDGVAGNLWFIAIYASMALRLSHQYGNYWFFAAAALAGLSNLLQANITDYYKTLHLYFISKSKGAEFTSLEKISDQHQQTKRGISKALYFLYLWYSRLQIETTPQLQKMLKHLHNQYGEDFPEDLRLRFRAQSKKQMPLIDSFSFNGRSIVLFLSVLSGYIWVDFIYEIVVLNIVLWIAIRKHEKMCKEFI